MIPQWFGSQRCLKQRNCNWKEKCILYVAFVKWQWRIEWVWSEGRKPVEYWDRISINCCMLSFLNSKVQVTHTGITGLCIFHSKCFRLNHCMYIIYIYRFYICDGKLNCQERGTHSSSMQGFTQLQRTTMLPCSLTSLATNKKMSKSNKMYPKLFTKIFKLLSFKNSNMWTIVCQFTRYSALLF